jgi:exopolysaccharide biosynthesis polyprenyl glycosylphosphotransferase
MREATAVQDIWDEAAPAAPGSRRRATATIDAYHRVLSLVDAAFAILALVVATRARAGWTPASAGDVLIVFVLTPLAWLLTFQFFGAYWRPGLTPGEEVRRVLGGGAAGTLALAAIASWRGLPATTGVLGTVFVVASGLALVGRWGARALGARTRRTGALAVPTIVIGTNSEAVRLAAHLSSTGAYAPVGFVGPPGATDDQHPLPIVGDLADTEAVLCRGDVRCVYIAASALSADDIENVARACRRANAELHISTNVAGIDPSRLAFRSTGGVVALSVKPVHVSGLQAALKRTCDVVIGSAILVLALPLLGAIAALIRITSPGPAFFRQTRITKDDRPFTMYKFRSMVTDPERVLEGSVIDLTKPFFKLEDDPRLTAVGRALRSLSLDELPQLWNVVRGDMSLVGPRPLPAEQVAANAEFLAPRHEVRGGLTGLWQVSGRSDLDSAEALRIDRFYIENWSLGLDLWILCRTVSAVLTRRGAV